MVLLGFARFHKGEMMHVRIAGIAAVALTAILMAGCTAAPTPTPTPLAVNVRNQPVVKDAVQYPDGTSQGTSLSSTPVSVGDVAWGLGGGSGGSSGDSSTIDSQEYLLLLTTEQMAAYEAAGNEPGQVTEGLAQSLSADAVIDSLRLRQNYPSVSITFTVKLAE